jgi:hypothetical protein
MKLILGYQKRVWQSVAFDTERGTGRVRWLRRAPARPAGWAVKHDGVWYAVWHQGTDLVFQASTLQWPMTDDLQCANRRRGGTRTFTISDGAKPVFELRYRALDRDDDPAFDSLDLELEDFFFWAARLWNDPEWRRRMVSDASA